MDSALPCLLKKTDGCRSGRREREREREREVGRERGGEGEREREREMLDTYLRYDLYPDTQRRAATDIATHFSS